MKKFAVLMLWTGMALAQPLTSAERACATHYYQQLNKFSPAHSKLMARFKSVGGEPWFFSGNTAYCPPTDENLTVAMRNLVYNAGWFMETDTYRFVDGKRFTVVGHAGTLPVAPFYELFKDRKDLFNVEEVFNHEPMQGKDFYHLLHVWVAQLTLWDLDERLLLHFGFRCPIQGDDPKTEEGRVIEPVLYVDTYLTKQQEANPQLARKLLSGQSKALLRELLARTEKAYRVADGYACLFNRDYLPHFEKARTHLHQLLD